MHREDHAFDRAIALTRQSEDWLGRTSPEYENLLGQFGGVLAAVAMRAVLDDPARQGEPIALTVNFAAALSDGDYAVTARATRTNRSTQHWSVEIVQGGQIAATATVVCAVRRETWAALDLEFPQVPPADDIVPAESTPGLPPFFANYDLRVVRGGSGPFLQHEVFPGDTEVTMLWIRDRPARHLDYPSLAAICDIFFPRIFVRRQRPAAIATVSLTVYFHAGADELEAVQDRSVLGVARATRFTRGYYEQRGEVWSERGELLATTTQLVYYKE
ncbi:MAG: acyl-CoA thioesterase [Lysobacter sp.]